MDPAAWPLVHPSPTWLEVANTHLKASLDDGLIISEFLSRNLSPVLEARTRYNEILTSARGPTQYTCSRRKLKNVNRVMRCRRSTDCSNRARLSLLRSSVCKTRNAPPQPPKIKKAGNEWDTMRLGPLRGRCIRFFGPQPSDAKSYKWMKMTNRHPQLT